MMSAAALDAVIEGDPSSSASYGLDHPGVEVTRMPASYYSAAPSSAQEDGLAVTLVELWGEMRGGLARIEALQKHWGDPLDERSALRRALRAELRAQRRLSLTGPDGGLAEAVAARGPAGPHSNPASPSHAFRMAVPELDAAGAHLSPEPSMAVHRVRTSASVPSRPSGPGSSSQALDGSVCRSSANGSACLSLEQEVTRLETLDSKVSYLSPMPRTDTKWRLTRKNTYRSQNTCRSSNSTPSVLEPSALSGPIGWARLVSWKLVHRHGKVFDAVIGFLIVASSICVGVEIQCDLEDSANCENITHELEHVFLVAFTVELLIRSFADGLVVLRGGWFRFDAILVAIGVISSWVIEPVLLITMDNGGSVFLDILSLALILRLLRLVRLVRALRLFEQFHEMWKIANGFMAALRTVLSACILIVLIVYAFACLGIELITRNSFLWEDPAAAAVIESYFPSLQVTMLTLVQFANTDSISVVYKPIVERAWHLVFYFGLVWLIVTIMAWNLITALIVDTAIVQGDFDRELELAMKRKRLRILEPLVTALFQELDKSGKGLVGLSDFRAELEALPPATTKRLPADLRKILESDQLIEVCEYLDADGSGSIDEQEFVEGIFSLMLQTVPIETTQMLQLLRSQRETLKMMQNKLLQDVAGSHMASRVSQ